MIQHIDDCSLKRRMGDVGKDLQDIKSSLKSRLLMPIVKRLMLSVVQEISARYIGEAEYYALAILAKPLTESTFVNQIAIGKNEFRPISVARIVCTEDLTFGLRVIAYSENDAFEKRVLFNENATEIHIPPAHIADVLTKHINLCKMFNAYYRIFERKDSYVVMTTGEMNFVGVKIKTVTELLLSKDDSPMFRKPPKHRRIL